MKNNKFTVLILQFQKQAGIIECKMGSKGCETGMAKILAFVNQKGGVGKTTSAVNLAAALQKAGKRVLLCDFDPQANATSGLGVEKSTAAHSTYDIVIEDFPAADAVIRTSYCDVLASNVALSGAGVELVGVEKREYALRHALEPLREKYDYIFIDCPPSLELLTLNALCAADQVLIPVQCEYYALEGLSDLMVTLRAVKKRLNPSISIFGVLLTMYDGRTNFSAQVAEEVRRHFPARSLLRPSRATCDYPKRPATACPCVPMINSAAVQRPMTQSRRRSLRKNSERSNTYGNAKRSWQGPWRPD